MRRNPASTDLHQSTFSLIGYPFSLKFLLAPVIDAFYIKRLGRRESWILPLQLLSTLLLAALANRISPMLDASPPEVANLTMVMFALVAATAAGDIATDAWAAGKMSDSSASVCQAVGLTLGSEGSSTVFFLLMGRGLLDIAKLFQLMSTLGFVVIGCFILQMLQKGSSGASGSDLKEAEVEPEPEGIRDVFSRSLSLIRGSANVRWWLAFSVLIPILGGHRSLVSVRYQAAGFSPEIFAEYDLYLLPVSLVVMWLGGKIAQSRYILTCHSWVCVLKGLVDVVTLLHFRRTREMGESAVQDSTMRLAYIVLNQLGGSLSTVLFVISCAVNNRIAQKNPLIAGSVITFMASMTNLGGLLPATWVPIVAEYAGIDATAIFCLASGFTVLLAFWQKLRQLEDPEDAGW
ncbi:unnamed protein product [Polarella glacialis]|uniref:Uncharacterized protein n=1 Tax=Polarella glacialis TaxID=89957 RepID=A0A813HM04_POLGL|nr:unnamed protein product [Polarella glacialis]